ncbi:hypothetical protein MF406_10120 [Georgenia sp. TF02-10]|uniref:hypothetical protein n=1 Tax=Georgenia sp. TF02-10 TaxID=2917725 RepID=UPI001FA7DE41|nr:hypothetical protein [Georgenia sp. TF02-10]UNX53368.1 hypothetical protein MF406_10120 [Georgenia sp. TF02-10]
MQRSELAASPLTPPEVLRDLAKDPSKMVVAGLIFNENAPPEVLRTAAATHPELRTTLGAHHNAPVDLMEQVPLAEFIPRALDSYVRQLGESADLIRHIEHEQRKLVWTGNQPPESPTVGEITRRWRQQFK